MYDPLGAFWRVPMDGSKYNNDILRLVWSKESDEQQQYLYIMNLPGMRKRRSTLFFLMFLYCGGGRCFMTLFQA